MHRFVAVLVGVAGLVAASGPAAAREISFDERVRAQAAIERVYWSHRIWPRENPTPKPSFETAMPEALLRASVADYLRKSNALELVWHRPVGAMELQAELDRMSKGSKDPATLNELFQALGDDPQLIAETLARQSLVDRLTRDWYAFDPRFHSDVRRLAELARSRASGVGDMKSMGGRFVESRLIRRGVGAGAMHSFDSARDPMELSPEDWTDEMSRLAEMLGSSRGHVPVGRISKVRESADTFFVAAVLDKSAGAVAIRAVTWPKTPFESWWTGEQARFGTSLAAPAASYRLGQAPHEDGSPSAWRPTRMPLPPRGSHSAIWTGTEMIVWGGDTVAPDLSLRSGGRYNPATDTWIPTSTDSNCPSPRADHVAVWTGTEMIVWGGRQPDGAGNPGPLGDGGRYDPVTDTWSYIPFEANTPRARYAAKGVWTGHQLVVWGGRVSFTGTLTDTGGRYDPSTNLWTATSLGAGLPEARANHTAVWTGAEMIIWGGTRAAAPTALNSGARYEPISDTWTPTSIDPATPSARSLHTAIWTGSRMIVWGGSPFPDSHPATGGVYDPATDTWRATSTVSPAPSVGRSGHVAVWTGSEMIVWGGQTQVPFGGGGGHVPKRLNDGGRYDPVLDRWRATSTGPNTPAYRHLATAVWSGSEMIVWGGIGGDDPATDLQLLGSGGRYDPSTDSWVGVWNGAGAPSARSGPASVWTGSEVIVWGGRDPYLFPPGPTSDRRDGGRYLPSIDDWRQVSLLDAPSERVPGVTVWTGREMIIWGGDHYPTEPRMLNSGGRYDPVADRWSPTSTDGAVPSPRFEAVGVWTGRKLVVWGGRENEANWLETNTGGRYDPETDTWESTSLGPGVPTPRTLSQAVWTGKEMVVWGGGVYFQYVYFDPTNSGARYDPASDTWTPTSTGPSVPVGRFRHSLVWTGREMIVWGGQDSVYRSLSDGGRYDAASDTWTSIGPDRTEPMTYHTTVWTGNRMIVWGGLNRSGFATNSGALYDPATDTWEPTSKGDNVPSPRYNHSAVWTGTEMIIWGGATDRAPYITNTGGAYLPTIATNLPPIADAGPDQVLECEGQLSAVAQLDGAASSDPDSAPGTNDDITSFEWSELGAHVASGARASVSLGLGAHDVTLTVTDAAGERDDDHTAVTIQDTQRPVGSITSPTEGACFGPAALPVVLVDDYTDVCDPTPRRTYSPGPGPFADHGDYLVSLRASDVAGNEAESHRPFTIDKVPPHVELLEPAEGGILLPTTLPMSLVFRSSDDDGASGGVVHQIMKLQGCTLFDGASYGNRDGLLEDEELFLTQPELCRIASECGLSSLNDPTLAVEATDCGGNVGSAARTLHGAIDLRHGLCAASTPKPIPKEVGSPNPPASSQPRKPRMTGGS